MKTPLRILHLEDNSGDAELVRLTLQDQGVDCALSCVRTGPDFQAALEKNNFDLILSDFSLPKFDGLSALKMVREQMPDMPFIIVSGTMGEDAAVESLRLGATDYVLKDRLPRLATAVHRAMRDADERAKRKRAEEQIHEQARLLDLAQDAILVCDFDHHIQFWNQSAERLYGWTAAEVQQKSVRELLFQNPEKFDEARRLLMERGDWSGELQKTTRDGRQVLVSTRWTLVRDAQGAPKSILVIDTDITEKTALEAQFLRAQRVESIGRLASGVAHDLNNILAPILMIAPMLRMGLSAEELEKLVGQVESSAQRGAQVVKQLLTLGRGGEGPRGVVQPRHLIREMARIVKETFPKTIVVEQKIGRDLWTLTGDVTQLHQVLLNLCVNARDAMPQGGKLSMRAENVQLDQVKHPDAKVGPYVLLQVKDEGSGIPAEVMDKMFEPFFTTKEPGKGTGLGLATVMGIVRSHGGFIEAESEVGKGTNFKVYLPATPEVIATETLDTFEEPPKGHAEVILVVDDEAHFRDAVSRTLGNAAYQTVIAVDGADAIAVFSKHQDKIKVVLCDLIMPVLDGVGVARILKKINPQVKIIASSGLADDPGHSDKIAELRALGVKTFLAKPYEAKELLIALNETLREN